LTPSRSDRYSQRGGWPPAIGSSLFDCLPFLADCLVSALRQRNGKSAFSSRDRSYVVTQLKPTQLAADECSRGQPGAIDTPQFPRPVGRQNLRRAQIGDADDVLELLWLLFTAVQAVACSHQNRAGSSGTG